MTNTERPLAEALRYYEQALLTAFPYGARGQVYESWNRARKALNAHESSQQAAHEAAAEPAGEAVPVAWPSAADIADEIDALLPMSHGDSTRAAIEEWWRQLVKRKLSKIAPPAAEPLTDEQLRAALTGRPTGWITDTVRQIARDVESAHGIGASSGEVQK